MIKFKYMYKYFFKRLIDLIIVIIILIITFPITLIVYFIVLIKMGEPVFFKQERAGKNLKSFKIIKFRTMLVKGTSTDNDSLRLTKIGAILRKTSIDELPQLFNILKGDMSFIGPRPLLIDYNKYYYPNELKRFEVRPGMSGYAEIKGRHKLSWEEQFNYDIEYVENLTFLFDANIFFTTIPKVLNSTKVVSLSRGTFERLDQERKSNFEI